MSKFFDFLSAPFSIGADIYNAIMSKKAFDYNKEMSDKYYDLNKQNQEFNQQLATRQQDLSEESYRNGVVNEANQLRSLGINPASQGGAISGSTMQGGSNVGSSGSASSINPAESISTLASIMMQRQSIKNQKEYNDKMADVAQYNAETDRMNAETNARNAGTNEFNASTNAQKVASEILRNDSYVRYIDSQTKYQEFINDDVNLSNEQLHSLGLSRETLKAWSNINWSTAVALGITSLLGNVSKSDNWDYSSERRQSVELASAQVIENAQSYEALAPAQKSVVDKFYEDHPNINRTGKDFPSSNFTEWKRSGYSDEQIYGFLKRYYGV